VKRRLPGLEACFWTNVGFQAANGQVTRELYWYLPSFLADVEAHQYPSNGCMRNTVAYAVRGSVRLRYYVSVVTLVENKYSRHWLDLDDQ